MKNKAGTSPLGGELQAGDVALSSLQVPSSPEHKEHELYLIQCCQMKTVPRVPTA